jgi:hypothetical protein
MGQRLADMRDSVAVTLMGWVAKLASKQYRTHLATYIQLGMAVYDVTGDDLPVTYEVVEDGGLTCDCGEPSGSGGTIQLQWRTL